MKHKFPRTGHILGSSKVDRSDLFIGPHLSLEILSSPNIELYEKLDGSNVGISFDKDARPLFQHRGAYFDPDENLEFKKLREWHNIHENELFDVLGNDLILFGEWMYYTHSVKIIIKTNTLMTY